MKGRRIATSARDFADVGATFSSHRKTDVLLEARVGIEPAYTALQAAA
jgi:hypothetical protein